MNKHILIITTSLFFILPSFLHSQTLTYSKVFYDSPQSAVIANAVAPSFDNGLMIAGLAKSQKGFLLKTDSVGNEVWNKTFDNGNAGIFPDISFNSIIATNDSCFVIAGSCYNAASSHPDAFCMKVNADGDTLWTKVFRCLNSNGDNAIALEQTNDSGYVITGTTSQVGSLQQIFAAKLDWTGNLQWTTILTDGNNNNQPFSIKQSPDSGYVITGSQPHAFLIKLTPAGTLSWAKEYHALIPFNFSGNDMVITNNGFLCFLNLDYNVALMQTDFSGNILWNRTYNQPNGLGFSFNSTFPKVHTTSDNGFVFTSGSCGGSGITKTDSVGNVTWQKNLMISVADMVPLADGSSIIVGNGPLCGVRTSQVYTPQIGIIRTDSIGNSPNCVYQNNNPSMVDSIITTSLAFNATTGGTENFIYPVIDTISLITLVGCVDIVGGIDENEQGNEVVVYPNPSLGKFTFTSNDDVPVQIIISNILGEKIIQTETNSLQFNIDLAAQPSGIYFYRLLFPGGRITSGKLAVTQ